MENCIIFYLSRSEKVQRLLADATLGSPTEWAAAALFALPRLLQQSDGATALWQGVHTGPRYGGGRPRGGSLSDSSRLSDGCRYVSPSPKVEREEPSLLLVVQ